jgi:hypothetical protein
VANPLKIVGPTPVRQRVFADLCVRDVFFNGTPCAANNLYVKTEEVFRGRKLSDPPDLPVELNAVELDSGRIVFFAPNQPVWPVAGTLTWEELG